MNIANLILCVAQIKIKYVMLFMYIYNLMLFVDK